MIKMSNIFLFLYFLMLAIFVIWEMFLIIFIIERLYYKDQEEIMNKSFNKLKVREVVVILPALVVLNMIKVFLKIIRNIINKCDKL